MTDYDTMSVDDLVLELIDEILPEEMSAAGCKTPRYEEIESALRKAVIREATVGVGTVRREGKAPLEGAPEMDISCETKDGDYDLVPHKETP